MNKLDEIRQDHPPGYKGIGRAYNLNEIRESKPFIISFIAAIGVVILTSFSTKTFYDILIFWVGQVMSIFPNLLGFNLGGYALIVGFGNSELLQAMTKKLSGKNSSVAQQLSGIFAFAILLQLAAFIAAFVINFFDQLKFPVSNLQVAYVINIALLGILAFLGFWGLFIIPNLVSNVFTFGQMHHSYLTIKRIKAERERQSAKANQDGQYVK